MTCSSAGIGETDDVRPKTKTCGHTQGLAPDPGNGAGVPRDFPGDVEPGGGDADASRPVYLGLDRRRVDVAAPTQRAAGLRRRARGADPKSAAEPPLG